MNEYRAYMDRVSLTQAQHAQLMSALAAPLPAQGRDRHVGRYLALAACFALVCTAAWGLWSSGGQPLPPAQGNLLPAVTAEPNANIYAEPADPDAIYRADLDPSPAVQPGAVHLPHVATPAPGDPEYITLPVPSRDSDVYSIPPAEVDKGCLASNATELTLEACRADPVLGPHLPSALPSRFSFESGFSVSDGVGPDTLALLWIHGMEEIHVSLSRPEEAPAVMDVSDPSGYDVRLYSIPWCDSVPDAVREGGFSDPVFRYEDLTEEVLAARAVSGAGDSGDVSGSRFTFRVLYPDGVVAGYSMKGLTAGEAAAMLLPQ